MIKIKLNQICGQIMGKTFIEYIFLKRFRDKDFHINIKGKNILEEIKKGERPVIFVSGHFC